MRQKYVRIFPPLSSVLKVTFYWTLSATALLVHFSLTLYVSQRICFAVSSKNEIRFSHGDLYCEWSLLGCEAAYFGKYVSMICFVVHFYILQIEAVISLETLIPSQQIAQHHVPVKPTLIVNKPNTFIFYFWHLEQLQRPSVPNKKQTAYHHALSHPANCVPSA